MKDGGDQTDLPDIEFLSGEAAFTDAETVASPQHRWNSIVTALGAFAVVGLVLFLATGGDEASDVASPTSTEAPRPVDTTSSEAELGQASLDLGGVLLGDGPGLEWQPVATEVTSRWFLWSDGSFMTDNGLVELRVGIDDGEVIATEVPSPLLGYPGYRRQAFGETQVLTPSEEFVDHVLVITDEQEHRRVDLPAIEDLPEGDLIRYSSWVNGVVIGDQLVATVSTFASVDIAALNERLDLDLEVSPSSFIDVATDRLYAYGPGGLAESIVFADSDLTDQEIDQLRATNNHSERIISVEVSTGIATPVDLADLQWFNSTLLEIDGAHQLRWIDTANQSWVSTTSDGIEWISEPTSPEAWWIVAGSHVYDLDSPNRIRRSSDGGGTWATTASPGSSGTMTIADDVIAVGRPWNDTGLNQPTLVATPSEDLELWLGGWESEFELRQVSNNETILAGYLWDEFAGASWDPATSEHVFSDPSTGEELLRVPMVNVDIAAASADPLDEIMLARWQNDDEAPEWLITSATAVFGPDALVVDFVGGEGALLAVVTTTNGYELFIADVTAAAQQ